MNTSTLAQDIGKTGLLFTNGLKVLVNILDVKMAYGCKRYLVSPVSGELETWVDSNRVHFPNAESNPFEVL